MKKGWTEAVVADIAEVKLGRQRSPKNHAGDQMRPYVRAANVGWNGWRLEDVKRMHFSDAEMDTYALKPGDLLLNEASGTLSEVGKPAIWTGQIDDCAFQNTLVRVRSRGPDPRYLLHFFKHQAASGAFARRSRGVGIFHLGRTAVAETPMPLPPIEEQRRIAAVLDVADALRAKRRQSIAKLDTLTQSIFIEMFGDPVVNPMGWDLSRLGDHLAESHYGHRFYGKSYSDSGTRIVRITDVDEVGNLDFASMPRMDVSASDLKRHALRPGELIFARSGATVGKAALIRPDDPTCIAGAYFICMTFDECIDPEYGLAVLTSRRIQEFIERTSRQAAQQNFSGPSLRRLPLPVPPRDVQRDYVGRIASLRERRAEACKSQVVNDELFASLQQRAFRGEL